MSDQEAPGTAPGADVNPPRPRLSISHEDLAAPTIDDRVNELRDAATLQLVRQVGAHQAPPAKANLLRGAVVMLGLAGLVGGLVGWFLSEIIMRPDALDAPLVDDPRTSTGVWLTIFAVGLTGVLAAWEGIELRSAPKAWASLKRTLPIAAGLALVGGFLAQAMYEPMVDSAIEDVAYRCTTFDDCLGKLESALRIPRAIGFLMAGAAVGAGLGLGSRAKQRVINGLIGGAIGGFLGGLAFSTFSTGGSARAATFTITGVAVAIGIALVEQVRKELWLEIVTGGMAGKQFIIYHDRTLVGSSPHCGVTLIKDAGIAPEHAELTHGPRGTTIRALGQRPVVVNGTAVTEHQLGTGDQVQLGNTILRFATKEQAMPELQEAF